MAASEQLAHSQGVRRACAVLGVPRSSWYRARKAAALPKPPVIPSRPSPPRALTEAERASVRKVLNSERFQDCAPREVYATLLDEATYLCSWRTMYRILASHDEVRERRNQLCHPVYAKPELLATGPNMVWSWDIAKLRGPVKWTYYYLYVVLDIFSRYVPGWMIAEQESGDWAEQLIAATCAKQGIEPGQLTLHADRGSAMISRPLAWLLSDLGVSKTYARPHTPDDNPFSEAQFKTLKYRPDYPDRFGSVVAAQVWSRRFFHWYNNEHHHSALALLTPADVHYGRAQAMLQARQAVLDRAYAAHPERFVKGAPTVSPLPTAVWINPPPDWSDTSDPVPVLAAEPMV